jgi:DNA-binding response OmpR family regulator
MARIVVVEDDAATRKLIATVLKKAGHEVTDLDNGAEGLLHVLAELPDLVISDVEMPKINGFELLSDLRSTPETALTPVILLTARASQEDMQHALSQGANDYLTKPFDPDKLMAAIHRQLEILAGRLGPDAQRLGVGFEKTAPADLAQLSTSTTDRTPSRSASLEDTTPTEAMALDPYFEQSLSAKLAKLPRRPLGLAWAVSMQVHNAQALREAMPMKTWRALLRHLFLPISQD